MDLDSSGSRASSSSANGPNDVMRMLYTTPLGHFCRLPEVALALAQDRLAATISPLLQIPDFLSCEEDLLRDWEVERPAAALQAKESAARLEKEITSMPPAVRSLRIRLRVAALRRIDAAAVGREVFLPCAALFAEAHLLEEGMPLGFAMKVGTSRLAHYWPKPASEAKSEAWRADPELVEAVERRLLPLLPPSGPKADEEFAAAAALWLALSPMRDFEAANVLPLFPYSTIYPNGYVPRGYRVRIRPESLAPLGGSYLTLAAAGLSPYIAEPFDAYCESRQALLKAWMEDVPALAVAKWGQSDPHEVAQPPPAGAAAKFAQD